MTKKNRIKCIFYILQFLIIKVSVSDEIFVSTNGSDNNPGSVEEPLKTIAAARDKIRVEKKSAANSKKKYIVYIREGSYNITESIILEAIDSGSIDYSVEYTAYNNEKVRLTGGVDVKLKQFSIAGELIGQSKTSNNIESISLSEIGINELSEFTWKRTGRNQTFPEPIGPEEVFIDSAPMTLARWPDKGWARTQKINSTTEFYYNDERIHKWDKGTWIFGFWSWDWFDEAIPLKSIDIQKNLITLVSPHLYGLKENSRFFAFNTIAELDSDNEYYIDRDGKILYLIADKDKDDKTVTISIIKTPLIVIKDAANIKINGLLIEQGRDSGISITNSRNITASNLIVRNTGTTGIIISGGENVQVLFSEIYNNGTKGINMSGGDRKTLKPSKHIVSNNLIHDYGRRIIAKSSGIEIHGVGQVVYKNTIENARHMGIYFFGNDHIINENIIRNVCNDTSDAGAVYTGRDWSARGTTISKNFFYNINGMSDKINSDVSAIYLDDFASGINISQNIIAKTYRGVLIGGGRDNNIFQNLFYKNKIPISIDGRGLTWARNSLNKGSELMDALESVPYRSKAWKNKYPNLLSVLSKNPELPLGNEIYDNYFYSSGAIKINILAEPYIYTNNNIYTDTNPGFTNPEENDFTLSLPNSADKTLKNIPSLKFNN